MIIFKQLFYTGAALLIIFEVANVYFIIPMPGSDKMKALLRIAGKVQQDGKFVTETDIAAARELGATDMEIHDTVLIAAAFCMFNRYVDGLGATTPDDPELYDVIGKQRAAEGYMTRSVLMK